MKRSLQAVFILLVGFSPILSFALEPAEVAVVANHFVTDSVKLARYYMKQRGIPEENLIRINTSSKEKCSRRAYEEEIAGPVREFLDRRQGKSEIRCLVTMFGVPLKVAAPEQTRSETKELEAVRRELAALKAQLKTLKESQGDEVKNLKQRIALLEQQVRDIGKSEQHAAVDSELALVKAGTYPLKRWLPNPFFVGFQGKTLPVAKPDVLIVARLDGPSGEIVRRIIDDSLAAEATGLQGTAYFDARWARPDSQKKLTGNGFYDNSLHMAAEHLRSRQIKVVVNDQQALFQPGEAPNASLYAGWYSLSRYIDAFDWVPGAVGFHIASQECQNLKGKGRYWCKSMLEDGAAATIGPVAEPYLSAFPIPELFFRFLTDSYYTLGEAYFLSLPYLSWQMILVGDPLYRPFKKQ